MNNIQYEIKRREDGTPYVDLSDKDLTLEDRFFCVEITRYLVNNIIGDIDEKKLPEDMKTQIMLGYQMIDDLSNRVGGLITNSENAINDLNLPKDTDNG